MDEIKRLEKLKIEKEEEEYEKMKAEHKNRANNH
jgi:hypothetical protein